MIYLNSKIQYTTYSLLRQWVFLFPDFSTYYINFLYY